MADAAPTRTRRPRGPGGICLALVLLLAAISGGACRPDDEPAGRRTVLVFAAASLTDVLEALADSFETAHPGYDVVTSVAASSVLARQVEAGAPADVFFSASPSWMAYLQDRGRVVGPVHAPMGNRLVVVGRAAAPFRELAQLAQAGRLAVADPEHAPAGVYARAALECAGLWERLRGRLVPQLDVRSALFAVAQGAASAGIVYATDAPMAPGLEVLFEVPASCQPPIRYVVAQLAASPEPRGAALFVRYAGDAARAPMWETFGFERSFPDSSAAAS